MRALGAAMILAACGGAGWSAARDLDRQVRLLRDMGRAADRLRTEICLRRQPLPEAFRMLAVTYPAYFSGAEEAEKLFPELSFTELWRAAVRGIGLAEEAERALLGLVEDLAAGEPPEDAFDRCREELRRELALSEERRAKNARLYMAAGAALGSLVVIVLL